jgi:hypothetical protein
MPYFADAFNLDNQKIVDECYEVSIHGGLETITEVWRQGGQLSRPHGPAVLRQNRSTGTVIYEAWWKNNQLHRIGGPAVICRDPSTGSTIAEVWANNGKNHRTNGPAVIIRDAVTGCDVKQEWWNNGVLLSNCDDQPKP